MSIVRGFEGEEWVMGSTPNSDITAPGVLGSSIRIVV